MKTETTLTGGCLCGAIRYSVNAEPRDQTICHCSLCRKAGGAPLVAWMTFPKDQVTFEGQYTRYASSAEAERGFCSRCGSQLVFLAHAHPEEIDLTIASLDDPERVRPVDHIWSGDRLSWTDTLHELPHYVRRRVT